jgi:hypothetical protein
VFCKMKTMKILSNVRMTTVLIRLNPFFVSVVFMKKHPAFHDA